MLLLLLCLLGAVRNHTILPHTNDVDLALSAAAITLLEQVGCYVTWSHLVPALLKVAFTSGVDSSWQLQFLEDAPLGTVCSTNLWGLHGH